MTSLLARLLLFFGRAWPFTRGKDFALRHVMRRPALWRALTAAGWITTKGGFSMRIQTGGDYTSTALSLYGRLEPETEEFILTAMKDGGTFLDIGANVGYFSLLVAHRHPESEVHAFEPNPVIADILEDSIRTAKLEAQIQVHRLAVSDAPGTLPFVVDPENSGHSRLAQPGAPATHNVPVVTLDHWVQTQNLGRVACIKMDIEGAELHALRGMDAFFASQNPAIIAEAYDHQLREFGSTREALIQHLTQLGFNDVRPPDFNLYLQRV